MKISNLIFSSLKYYKKQHLALLIGTIISTAVLTGALIIGDSVRGSLNSLVDNRLGNAEHVLQSGDRFITQDLAVKISHELKIKTASLLQLDGIAINTNREERINKIQVLGVDQSFWKLSDLEIPEVSEDEAFVSQNVADRLGLKVDEEFLLRVENAEIIPLNAPFAGEKEATVSFRLKIKRILADDELGRYSLKSDQKAPFNVFVNQVQLARELELEGLINTILVKKSDKINEEVLNESIKKSWHLKDAGLSIRNFDPENTYEVLSDRIFIEKPISDILNQLQPDDQILTYLVNSIRIDSLETPYSFLSAVSQKDLKDNEIIVNDWLAKDLNASIGDTINVDYFTIGSLRQLEEYSHSFVVNDIRPIHEYPFVQSLMPEFPGLTDAGSCSDWNTGIPIDLDKIRDKDEDYWDKSKGTPKAIISLEKGHELWANKYGQYTSFRFNSNRYTKESLAQNILNKLNPQDLSLGFVNARSEGQLAAKNSTDFGELFLSLSFFVILGGVLLTILLFALNTASRSQETAILASIGYTRKRILKYRLAESSVVILMGSIIGVGVGILYNQLLLAGLNSVWQDAVKTDMLSLHLKSSTLFKGALSGLLISFLSIYFVTLKQFKQQLSASLKKQKDLKKSKFNWPVWIGWAAFAGAIGLVTQSIIEGVEQHASSFLTAGFLFLVAIVLAINSRIKQGSKRSHLTIFSFKSLILKNLGLHHKRNTTTIALLALGTFSVIITGANRKTFYGAENDNQSGTGGYLFWAETSIPILHSLETKDGQENYNLDPEVMKSLEFAQMFVLEGNDASCLNLNLVQNPTILGCEPSLFDLRNSFSFTKIYKQPRSNSPWVDLNSFASDNIYYAIADQTVIKWGLMKNLGDTLFYADEFGEPIGFILLAGLDNSVFQGTILVSNKVFEKHFPSGSYSKIMLVDGPEDKKEEIVQMLNEQFVDFGIELTPTSQRLAEFNSVTNSYLTVFMMLGGLGILIGTFGLGIVLLRNLQDRKYELALLKALGFNKKQIFRLVVYENVIILSMGLLTGIISAFIGILPSIISPAFSLPLGFVLLLVAAILVAGLLSIYSTATGALKRNYLEHLRRE